MTQTEKERRLQEESAKREVWHSKLRALFEPYNGQLERLRKITPKKTLTDAEWNKYHLFPVRSEDPVRLHPDQSGMSKNSVRVIYHPHRFVAILSKYHFEEDLS